MSRYGPPSGPFPGEPDPRYEPPSDPWGGGTGHWGDPTTPEPGYAPPPPPAGGYPPPDYGYQAGGYEHPEWTDQPRRPRRNAAMVALVAMLVLVVAGGLATALYLVTGERTPAAGTTPSPTGEGGGGGTQEPGVDGSPDNIGLAAGSAQAGDCLVNDGSEAAPQMRIALCDGDEEEGQVYLVLARFDQVVADGDEAQQTCAATEGYRFHYYFISEQEGQSFVLCMTDG